MTSLLEAFTEKQTSKGGSVMVIVMNGVDLRVRNCVNLAPSSRGRVFTQFLTHKYSHFSINQFQMTKGGEPKSSRILRTSFTEASLHKSALHDVHLWWRRRW